MIKTDIRIIWFTFALMEDQILKWNPYVDMLHGEERNHVGEGFQPFTIYLD